MPTMELDIDLIRKTVTSVASLPRVDKGSLMHLVKALLVLDKDQLATFDAQTLQKVVNLCSQQGKRIFELIGGEILSFMIRFWANFLSLLRCCTSSFYLKGKI